MPKRSLQSNRNWFRHPTASAQKGTDLYQDFAKRNHSDPNSTVENGLNIKINRRRK